MLHVVHSFTNRNTSSYFTMYTKFAVHKFASHSNVVVVVAAVVVVVIVVVLVVLVVVVIVLGNIVA